MERNLTDDINILANKSNMFLRQKLNANKGDFERLRHLGQIEGNVGADLERNVKNNDNEIMNILNIKKGSY